MNIILMTTSKVKVTLLACFFSFMIFGYTICAQEKTDVVPPSPNAAALMEYANVPVSYYTGTPQIEIPLMTLPGRHIDVPISLSYHASGIKVEEVASWAGLGWSLNAGGVITRVIKDEADESEQGYSGINQRGLALNDPLSAEQIRHTVATGDDHKWDYEPDLFYFNFMGISGKFVINPSGQVVMLPYQNLKIAPAIGPTASNNYWVITDEKGIKYFFGRSNSSRESTTIKEHYMQGDGTKPARCTDLDKNRDSFISAWYLDKIEFNGEVTNFTYESYSQISLKSFQRMKEILTFDSYSNSANGQPCWLTPNAQCIIDYLEIKTTPRYLTSITNERGTVTLISDNNRQDLVGGRRLKSLTLSRNSETIKTVELSHGYFQSDDCSSSNCKRLKLLSISNPPLVKKTFEYYEDENLPDRNTPKFDHWGYYNSSSNSNWIPKVTGVYDEGASRSPSLTKCRANSLKKIINANGGYQQFTYQLHKFRNQTINMDENAGGLRVSKITESDGANMGLNKETNIVYTKESDGTSAGLLFRTPIYYYSYSRNYSSSGTPNRDPNDPTPPDYIECNRSGDIIYSISPMDRFDLNGTHVGYSEVQINYSDGSTRELKFRNYEEYGDTYNANDYFKYSLGLTEGRGANIEPSSAPFAPPSRTKFWQRGMIKENKLLDSTDETLEKSIYNYEDFQPSSGEYVVAKGMRGIGLSSWTYGMTARVGRYQFDNKGLRLLSQTKYVYDQTNVSKKTTVTESFSYSDAYPTLVSEVTKDHSEGTSIVTEYRYPFDFSVIFDVLADMAGSKFNMLNYPVETVTKVNGKVTNAVINDYRCVADCEFTYAGGNPILQSGIIKPKYIRQLQIESPITDYAPATSGSSVDSRTKIVSYFDEFDDYGNLLQHHGSDGVNHSYIWGYDDTYPVAKVEGAAYDDIEGVTGFGENFALGSAGLSSGQRTNLRDELSDAHVTTYAYEPLVGMTQMWDPNGEETTYEYDDFNRLKMIKDDDGDIIERYRYSYASEEDNMTADFTINGCKKPGEELTFSAAQYFGPTTYIWDFGDGNIVESTDSEVAYTYSDNGTYTYTASLSILNPEYETVHKTTTVSLTPNIGSASVCGPYMYNPCFQSGSGNCRPEASDSSIPYKLSVSTYESVTHQWKYRARYNGTWQGWYNFGSNSREANLSHSSFMNSNGTVIAEAIEVKCEITPSCGEVEVSNTKYTTISLSGCN